MAPCCSTPRAVWRPVSASRAMARSCARCVKCITPLRPTEKQVVLPCMRTFVDASIRQFCASANARLQACADFDAKRQFLVGHVERVIYHRYKVTTVGSVSVLSGSGETKLQFRIEGEIDQRAVRSGPRINTS
jgi:hypothetical protein